MPASRMLSIAVLLAAAARLVSDASAYPSTYDFRYGNLTGHPTASAASGDQYRFELIDTGRGTVGFRFTNAGPLASAITDILLQISPSPRGLLTGIDSLLDSGAPVNFRSGARIESLTGSAAGTPDLLVNSRLSAFSRGANPRQGVNPGSEWIQLNFSLRRGTSFADIQAAVDHAYNNPASIWNPDGTARPGATDGIRVGIRVQGLPGGASATFIAKAGLLVPEPPSLLLSALGGIALSLHAATRRGRRRSLNHTPDPGPLSLPPPRYPVRTQTQQSSAPQPE